MFLLDTNVISELRRPRPHGAVLAWLASTDERSLNLSAVTVSEIQAGIEITREQDPAKASEIEAWLDVLVRNWNVIPMDATSFRALARLMHRKSDTLYFDGMIAATAQVHGFTVVTRNTQDFAVFGVPLLDPFRFESS